MAAAGAFDGPIGIIAAAIMARASRAAEEETVAELAARLPLAGVVLSWFQPAAVTHDPGRPRSGSTDTPRSLCW
jgi:hypothetical protein